MAFATICASAMFAGLYFERLSLPEEVSSSEIIAPQPIDIYVSDPDARVSVTVTIWSSGREPANPLGSADETVQLLVTAPEPSKAVSWMIFAPESASAYSSRVPMYAGFAPYASLGDKLILQGSTDEPDLDANGNPLPVPVGGRVVLTAKITQPYLVSREHFFAEMPSVMGGTFGQRLTLETNKADLGMRAIIVGAHYPPNGPASIPSKVGDSAFQDYYLPQATSATESLQAPFHFGEYRIDATSPSNFDYSSDALAWQGGAGLEPKMIATDIPAEESRGQFSFFAGIAFAMAVSALIALLQERPRVRNNG